VRHGRKTRSQTAPPPFSCSPSPFVHTCVWLTCLSSQIAVTNNWQDILYFNCDPKAGGAGANWWWSLFFVLYFIAVVWFGTNIMAAVIIDSYVQATDRRLTQAQAQEEKEKEKERKKRNGSGRKGSGTNTTATTTTTTTANPPAVVAATPEHSKQYSSKVETLYSGGNLEKEFRKKLMKEGSFVEERGRGDLENENVLALLQSELDKTHKEVSEEGSKIQRNLVRRGSNLANLAGSGSLRGIAASASTSAGGGDSDSDDDSGGSN